MCEHGISHDCCKCNNIENYNAKLIESQKLLNKLEKQYPTNQFRISPTKGSVQKKIGKCFIKVCEHNQVTSNCIICQGGSVCEHNTIRYRCRKCRGGAYCIHNKIKYRCKDCGGSQICVHNRISYYCKECKGKGICQHGKQKNSCKQCGGSAFCKHNKIKYGCKQCGGSSICKHNKLKALCRDCGGSRYCKHDKLKQRCSQCEGSQICKHGNRKTRCFDCKQGSGICSICNVRLVQKDNVCRRCHPSYVEICSQSSKIGCEFIDKLELVTGMTIKHKHVDRKAKKWDGEEYRLKEWKRKAVDGYIPKDQITGHPFLPSSSDLIIEFLGDEYHGHPTKWEKEINWLGRCYIELFDDTENKFKKMKKFGYNILYVWENDYKNLKSCADLLSVCRFFKNKIEF